MSKFFQFFVAAVSASEVEDASCLLQTSSSQQMEIAEEIEAVSSGQQCHTQVTEREQMITSLLDGTQTFSSIINSKGWTDTTTCRNRMCSGFMSKQNNNRASYELFINSDETKLSACKANFCASTLSDTYDTELLNHAWFQACATDQYMSMATKNVMLTVGDVVRRYFSAIKGGLCCEAECGKRTCPDEVCFSCKHSLNSPLSSPQTVTSNNWRSVELAGTTAVHNTPTKNCDFANALVETADNLVSKNTFDRNTDISDIQEQFIEIAAFDMKRFGQTLQVICEDNSDVSSFASLDQQQCNIYSQKASDKWGFYNVCVKDPSATECNCACYYSAGVNCDELSASDSANLWAKVTNDAPGEFGGRVLLEEAEQGQLESFVFGKAMFM